MINVCKPECPSRCPEPNCHMTCREYLEAIETYEEIKKIIQQEKRIQSFDTLHELRFLNEF